MLFLSFYECNRAIHYLNVSRGVGQGMMPKPCKQKKGPTDTLVSNEPLISEQFLFKDAMATTRSSFQKIKRITQYKKV